MFITFVMFFYSNLIKPIVNVLKILLRLCVKPATIVFYINKYLGGTI